VIPVWGEVECVIFEAISIFLVNVSLGFIARPADATFPSIFSA